MANNEQLLKYDENIGLYDHINPVLNLKDLSRKQVKELAKEIANNESQTHSWQEVLNDAVNYDSKNKKQEKRFKRIFNKQLNENLAPVLEKQHKQELIDRMKSGDASAMSQWTTEGIDKFGHQFMPVMLTAATLPFGIGAFGQAANTMGLLPALGAEAGSLGLGYGGYKFGSKLDDDFGTNWIAPTLSVAGGIGGYGAGYKGMVKLGSKGWLPKGDSFMYGSQFVGDVAADGLKRGIRTTRLNQPLLEPTMRFKVGDVEINDPNLYYRQGTKEMGDDFLKSGLVREGAANHVKPKFAGTIQLTKKIPFKNPMFSQGRLWYGVDSEMTDLLVANPSAKMQMANQHASPTTIASRAGVRRIPVGQLTSDETVLYRFEPGYGFRKQGNSSNTSYAFFERPSTYFKNATYAGTPGTYAGKEVPTWQLPKGQRNQPYNPTATERVYSVLGRDPNVPTGGISYDGFEQHHLYPLYKFLQQHGIDTKNITLGDLGTLYGNRFESIKTASKNNYNLAVPQGTEALPKEWQIRAFDPEGLVGEMSIRGKIRKHPDMDPELFKQFQKTNPGASVQMIRNATRNDGQTMYDPRYGWYTPEISNRTKVSGVSQRLYDAGIPVAQQTNNGKGLMSGEQYLQPQRSIAVMEHYPNKKIIKNNGEWHWENLDPTKVTTRDNPVYLLTQPSGKYKHIPTKATLFYPSAIKDGQITTNINHGSIFLEDGGKIENPDR